MHKYKPSVFLIGGDELKENDIANRLHAMGYQVSGVVQTGEQAISQIPQKKPDLVLMVDHLAGDTDSAACAEIIRSRFNLPLVLLTHSYDMETETRAGLYGSSEWVHLPFEENEICRAIEMGLYKHSLASQQHDYENRYKNLVELSPFSIFLVQNGRYVFVNPAGERLLGYAEAELIGKPVLGSITPSQQELIRQRLRNAEMGRSNPAVRLRLQRKDSTLVEVESISIPIQHQEKSAVMVVLWDITELKRTETALRQSEEKFRQIFEHAPICMALTSLDGKYIAVNQSFCKMLGYSQEELINLPYESFTYPEDIALNQTYRQALLQNQLEDFQMEKRYYTKAGQMVYVLLQVTLLRDSEGAPLYFIAQAIDITDRKQAESRLFSALREKEVMIKEIHHRVKNNLQIVSSLLDLQAQVTEDDEVRHILEEGKNRVHSMALVHDRLYQSGNLSEVRFGSYIHDLVDDLQMVWRSEKNIEITVEAEEVILKLEDAIPCGLIVNELLTNALKHAFKGRTWGKVNIRITQEVFIDDESERAYHNTISISDNGVGFPPQKRHLQKSNSLGLRLVRVLVDQLNGKMEIINKDGTEFIIHF